jgi:hypothetical protein
MNAGSIVPSSSAAPTSSAEPTSSGKPHGPSSAPHGGPTKGSHPSATTSCDEEDEPTGYPSHDGPTKGSHPPPPATTSCDEEDEPTGYPSPPKVWATSYAGTGPWGPPSNGTKTSTYLATGTGAYPSSTYVPLQANGATTLGMSLIGAAGALVAAMILL